MENYTDQTIGEVQELMRENLSLLQDYAMRMLVQEDDSLAVVEDFKNELMAEYMAYGKSLLLTERDLVVLLLKYVWD